MIFPLVVGWQWGLNTSYLLCRAAGGVGVGVGVWCLVFGVCRVLFAQHDDI